MPVMQAGCYFWVISKKENERKHVILRLLRPLYTICVYGGIFVRRTRQKK